ncbi:MULTISPECIES: restriction endonuclease subunit S [Bacillus cereus group]|uniref:restriction endonuclease subunit S n=1 Tax=Bacillus cereus group TaxID=86661 RepID=UPI0001DA5FEC|nr:MULTISPECIES: restriction endonuclease subunit S [Bacillus cereus group]EFI64707.1 Type I restriction-modification enzyme, S subunit [Bacillus cereus SJ1]MEC4696082.1 restriction endonuclease subunit S [Bacillus anthracis]
MSEWQKLKDVVVKIVGGGTPSRKKDEYYHGDIPWVTVKDLIATSISDAQEKITPQAIQESAANLIPKSNVIIATRMALGKAFINEVDVAINQDLKALIPNKEKVIPKYLLYTYLSNKEKIEILGSGTTVKGIRLEQINGLEIFVPSLEEQKKITFILSSVDQIIEKTKAIIEQTEKVKKGLMQQLLTEGIGHTKFKETDIGNIPEEWEVLTFEEISDLITKGTTPTTYGFSYEDTGVNFIRTENIDEQGKVVKDYMKKISLAAHQKLKRSILKEKDILFSIAGVGLGQCTIVKEDLLPANTNQALAIIRISNPLFDHHFVYTLLLSHYITKQIKAVSTIGAQPNISLKQIGDFKIPKPTLREQKRIVDILSSVGEKIQREKVKLDTLQTIKTGLMQSLLTGEIRVKADEAEVTEV